MSTPRPPELDPEQLFAPLRELRIDVDAATKARLLAAIMQEDTQPEPSKALSEWLQGAFRWLARPLPVSTVLATLLLSVLTWAHWTGNQPNSSALPQTFTLPLADGMGDNMATMSAGASLAGRSEAGGYATEDMAMTLPAMGEGAGVNIQDQYTYTLAVGASGLSLNLPDQITQLTFKPLTDALAAELASNFGFSADQKQTECLQYEIMPFGLDASDTVSDCAGQTAYTSDQASLSLSLGDDGYFSYSEHPTQSAWEQAPLLYDQLPSSLNTTGWEDSIARDLIEKGLIDQTLLSQFQIVRLPYTDYTCPPEEDVDYSTAEGTAAPTGCLVRQVYEGRSEPSDMEFVIDPPQRTANRPRPFQTTYAVIPKTLSSLGNDYSVLQVIVDHTGHPTEINGQLPAGLKDIPLQHGSLAEVIDALNQGELTSDSNWLATTMLVDGGSASNQDPIVLKHQVRIDRATATLTTYQGADGALYLVPAYQMEGLINYDELPADKAAREDASLRQRCAELQSELVQAAPSEPDVLMTDEEYEKSLEDQDAAFKVYEEMNEARCYVLDSDPDEESPYTTTVPAFPGLRLVTGGAQ